MQGFVNRRIHHCSFCGARETLDHLFFLCPHAVSIWIHSPLRSEINHAYG